MSRKKGGVKSWRNVLKRGRGEKKERCSEKRAGYMEEREGRAYSWWK